MTRTESIAQALESALSPVFLEVIDESDDHSVPRGSETHFKVVVVSRAFDGKGRVDRHRMVNATLRDHLAAGVHALAITARTPDEWASPEGAVVPASPLCLGGSKQNS